MSITVHLGIRCTATAQGRGCSVCSNIVSQAPSVYHLASKEAPSTGTPTAHLLALNSGYPRKHLPGAWDLTTSTPSSETHNASQRPRNRWKHLGWYLRSLTCWSQAVATPLHKPHPSVAVHSSISQNTKNTSAFPQNIFPAFTASSSFSAFRPFRLIPIV